MIANYYEVEIPEEYLKKVLTYTNEVQEYITTNAEGCIKYRFTRGLERPLTLDLFTVWENKECYEKNLASAYQLEVFNKLMEYGAVLKSAERFSISEYQIEV